MCLVQVIRINFSQCTLSLFDSFCNSEDELSLLCQEEPLIKTLLVMSVYKKWPGVTAAKTLWIDDTILKCVALISFFVKEAKRLHLRAELGHFY